jgi:hypothetical protein
MEKGKFYDSNYVRLGHLSDDDWRIALAKCKEHIKFRLQQKTLSGAHSPSNLGADPVDHYLGLAYEKIMYGDWEWKIEYSLVEQMIRIVNSSMSKQVEKVVSSSALQHENTDDISDEFKEYATSSKAQPVKIIYEDIEEEFYDVVSPVESTLENTINEAQLQAIETAASGDEDLEYIVEGLKEGKKRAELADLLGISLRQFDKLREKLIRKIKIISGVIWDN